MSDSPRATSVETTSKRILYSPAHQLTVPRMRSAPRVFTSVLFILQCVHNMLHYTGVSSSDNSCLFVLTTVEYWSFDREYHKRPNSANNYSGFQFCTVRRSYAYALILRVSTSFGLGVQFTPSNDTMIIHILFKEVDWQNARPSKVLTTERLTFSATIKKWRAGAGKAMSGYTLPFSCYFLLVVWYNNMTIP